MQKSRIETLTDGIIAIAATIMVMALDIPEIKGIAGFVEVRHTFIAYIISFFMIYIVWSMHHDLFRNAEVISRRTFMVNGIWLFFLTLVPFTTNWVGVDPYGTFPEFLYPLNLLLWSGSLQWLDHEVVKDNPGIEKEVSTGLITRIIMYGGLVLCMMFAFVKPILSRNIIAMMTMTMFIWTYIGRRIGSE